jgi:hypothetical protein
MVRRAAAQNLASFARIVEPDLVPSEFLPLFQYLTQDGERSDNLMRIFDISTCQVCFAICGCLSSCLTFIADMSLLTDQDSVRLLAVECCGPLAQLCRKDDVMTHILPVVQKFSQV